VRLLYGGYIIPNNKNTTNADSEYKILLNIFDFPGILCTMDGRHSYIYNLWFFMGQMQVLQMKSDDKCQQLKKKCLHWTGAILPGMMD
jgi:hypothetical protein